MGGPKLSGLDFGGLFGGNDSIVLWIRFLT